MASSRKSPRADCGMAFDTWVVLPDWSPLVPVRGVGVDPEVAQHVPLLGTPGRRTLLRLHRAVEGPPHGDVLGGRGLALVAVRVDLVGEVVGRRRRRDGDRAVRVRDQRRRERHLRRAAVPRHQGEGEAADRHHQHHGEHADADGAVPAPARSAREARRCCCAGAATASGAARSGATPSRPWSSAAASTSRLVTPHAWVGSTLGARHGNLPVPVGRTPRRPTGAAQEPTRFFDKAGEMQTETPTEMPAKRRRKWPWFLGGGVLLIVIAAIAGPFIYIHFIQADPPPAPHVRDMTRMPGDGHRRGSAATTTADPARPPRRPAAPRPTTASTGRGTSPPAHRPATG